MKTLSFNDACTEVDVAFDAQARLHRNWDTMSFAAYEIAAKKAKRRLSIARKRLDALRSEMRSEA